MRFPCPECDVVTPHPVVRTERHAYYWSDRHSAYFESMAGVDVQYGVRERRCERCGEQTRTAETSADVLAALVGEVDRLSALLEAQTRHEALSYSRHLPGAIAFVAEVFGHAPEAVDPRLSWQAADRVLGEVSIFLAAVEPELAAWVRYRHHLWDRPARPPQCGTSPLSRLRHPSRSHRLAAVRSLLFPQLV